MRLSRAQGEDFSRDGQGYMSNSECTEGVFGVFGVFRALLVLGPEQTQGGMLQTMGEAERAGTGPGRVVRTYADGRRYR